jgi:hypothetical protein
MVKLAQKEKIETGVLRVKLFTHKDNRVKSVTKDVLSCLE